MKKITRYSDLAQLSRKSGSSKASPIGEDAEGTYYYSAKEAGDGVNTLDYLR
ncbi:MAG: hypothetical protein WDO16_19145 [Bacteroidota bacterium]